MKRICLLLALLVGSGCAHTPAEKVKRELSQAAVVESIIKDKTTKDDFVAVFGPPNAIEKNTHLPPKEVLAKATKPLPPIARTVEFWKYWKATDVKGNVDAGNASARVVQVTLFIDENGVIVDYQAIENNAAQK